MGGCIFGGRALACSRMTRLSSEKESVEAILMCTFSDVSLFVLSLCLLASIFNLRAPGDLVVRAELSRRHSGLSFLGEELSTMDCRLRRVTHHSGVLCHRMFNVRRVPSSVERTNCNNISHCTSIESESCSKVLASSVVHSSILLGGTCLRSGSCSSISMLSTGTTRVTLYIPSVPPMGRRGILLTSNFNVHSSPFHGDSEIGRGNISLSPGAHGSKRPVCTAKSNMIRRITFRHEKCKCFILVGRNFNCGAHCTRLASSVVMIRNRAIGGKRRVTAVNGAKHSAKDRLRCRIVFVKSRRGPMGCCGESVLPRSCTSVVSSSGRAPVD